MFVCKCIPQGPREVTRGPGNADFTGVEDDSTVLCKKQSRVIQQQYFIQVSAKKKKNSFFNKQELNFASELNYRFQDLFKEEMPMFKALVLKMKSCLEKTRQNGCPLIRLPFLTSGFHLVLELSSCLACMYLT